MKIKDGKASFSKTKAIFTDNIKGIFFATLIFYGVIITQMWALSLTYAAYIIAVKRISAIFTVVFAYFVLKERKNFMHVLLGVVLMVIGVVLLAF